MITRRLLLAATAMFAAAPAYAADPVEITFWHSLGNQGTVVVSEVVEKFNASQTAYRMKAEFVGPYEDTVVKLQAAIPAKKQPDLMMLEVTRYGLFADAGVLEDLDPYLAKEGAAFIGQYLPFALEGPKYQGKAYVLPFNVSTPVMYWNKDAFKEAGLDPDAGPKTWGELRDAALKTVKRDGDKTARWGVSGFGQFTRWGFVAQAGGEWVDPKSDKVLMDTPETISAYTYLADFVRKDKTASLEAAIDEKLHQQLFQAGQAAIHFGSTGDFGNMRKNVKFNLGVGPLPCGVKCAAPIGGATIGMSSAIPAARKAGAWAFLKFISSPEINAITFVKTGYLPIMKGTVDVPMAKEAIAQEPGYSVAIKQLDVAFVRSRPPAMAAMRAREPNVWEQMVLARKPDDVALKDFATEMRGMMKAQ